MLVAVITDRAEVVVGALGALPANAKDRLLVTGVAHRAVVLQTCATSNLRITRHQ